LSPIHRSLAPEPSCWIIGTRALVLDHWHPSPRVGSLAPEPSCWILGALWIASIHNAYDVGLEMSTEDPTHRYPTFLGTLTHTLTCHASVTSLSPMLHIALVVEGCLPLRVSVHSSTHVKLHTHEVKHKHALMNVLRHSREHVVQEVEAFPPRWCSSGRDTLFKVTESPSRRFRGLPSTFAEFGLWVVNHFRPHSRCVTSRVVKHVSSVV